MNEDSELKLMFKEFLHLYKLINRAEIIKVLNSELNSSILKSLYKMSDGNASSRTIGVQINISHTSVSNYWKQWALKGIVEPASIKGRYKSVFCLSEYGLDQEEEQD